MMPRTWRIERVHLVGADQLDVGDTAVATSIDTLSFMCCSPFNH